MASLAADTTVKQIDSHTYTADFNPAWTIGTVPHGGYVTSIFQRVVRAHFDTTLSKQNQPHTITLHLDFLRRTQTGPATFKVKDIKLGRQTSVVHVTLSQENREEVVGYITNSNIPSETGPSFTTGWKISPASPPADLAKLPSDTDPNWAETKERLFAEFRKAPRNVRCYHPRRGQAQSNIEDQWMCLRNGENWTNESLGFVVDLFPQIIETYTLGYETYSVSFAERFPTEDEQTRQIKKVGLWYPTLLLNLDVKKALPEAGVKWLFTRLLTKQIKNGRFDLELVVKDAEGDLVALSHHVCLAVDAARNTAARRKTEGGEAKL